MTVYPENNAGVWCSHGSPAPFNKCTAGSISFYSVDCSTNGTNTDTANYTTIYASSAETPTFITTSPATASSPPGTNSLISKESPSSSSITSSPSQTSSTSSTDAPPPSPSSYPVPEQSNGNGGLSRAGKIGIGAVIGPVVLALVVLVYFGWKTRKRRKMRARQSGENATQSCQKQTTTPSSESQGSHSGNIHHSRRSLSASSSFHFIPSEPQVDPFD